MEVAEQLVASWQINDRLNRYLLEEVGEAGLSVALSKGKAVDAQFAHIHNVRLMWLKVAAPTLCEPLSKLEKGSCTLTDLRSNLSASGDAVAEMIRISAESDGRVKGFKPHVTAFVGYMIAHEANHRGQIELALRQAGVPLDDKVAYGMWEWGAR